MINLNDIRIVLVQTSHPGNIGAAARAMKTMGLNHLTLVAPKEFPHTKADEMASGAVSVLGCATVVDTLEQAIADCVLVVGTSTRLRAIPWPLLTPRELPAKIGDIAGAGKIAIVFGREQSGLTNDELHHCHYHVSIPSHADYGSLNLAAAVQVIAYELYVASLAVVPPPSWDYDLATMEQLEGFFLHLQQVLVAIDFLKPSAPRQLMTRLRRLFYRAKLDTMEVNILRGILKAME